MFLFLCGFLARVVSVPVAGLWLVCFIFIRRWYWPVCARYLSCRLQTRNFLSSTSAFFKSLPKSTTIKFMSVRATRGRSAGFRTSYLLPTLKRRSWRTAGFSVVLLLCAPGNNRAHARPKYNNLMNPFPNVINTHCTVRAPWSDKGYWLFITYVKGTFFRMSESEEASKRRWNSYRSAIRLNHKTKENKGNRTERGSD